MRSYCESSGAGDWSLCYDFFILIRYRGVHMVQNDVQHMFTAISLDNLRSHNLKDPKEPKLFIRVPSSVNKSFQH